MDCSASTKSAYLFWNISAPSAVLLTRRRRLADRAQTLPQTLPQTLARQEGRKGAVLPEDGKRGALEKNPTEKPQNAHFLVRVLMVEGAWITVKFPPVWIDAASSWFQKVDGLHQNCWIAFPGFSGRHASESLDGMHQIQRKAITKSIRGEEQPEWAA
jgi:hypothetical protein